jgi:hypothetical protein
MGPYGSDVGFAVALLAIAVVVLTVTLALEYILERRNGG